MKISVTRILLVFQLFQVCAFASNSVVNLSHYDLMHVDFALMKREGIVGVIHEATYPRFDRDSYYGSRQESATRAGLLWGAYHFGDATDPVRQADHFLDMVASEWQGQSLRRDGVLLVLDFEKNDHYPGGTMRVDQAVTFVERIRQRTGKYPGVYGSENRLRTVLNARGVSPSQRQILANCWLWIANYHSEPRNTAPWDRWHLWQYTGDGTCDLPRAMFPKSVANIRKAERNIFRGSLAGLQAFWQQHAWQPAGEAASRQKPRPKMPAARIAASR
ncbi:MAG: glycoside hydrolase family 25 protein [Chthoniobacterales bacterium]